MSSVHPALAPQPIQIEAVDLCRALPEGIGKEAALLALGAISNLYCLSALERPEPLVTEMRGFTSDDFAPLPAVLGEIHRALPGIGRPLCSAILRSLSDSLDGIVAYHDGRPIRLTGFGLIARMNGERSVYHLEVELPLIHSLRLGTEDSSAGSRAGA